MEIKQWLKSLLMQLVQYSFAVPDGQVHVVKNVQMTFDLVYFFYIYSLKFCTI